MRKILIGGIAALIAATSLATTADAARKWRHHGWHNGHHAGWHHRGWKRHGWRHGGWRHGGWRGGVWIGGPRIVIGGGCVVRKHINRNGWVVKRRYC